MKRVAAVKLQPDNEQAHALKETLERCNEACTWLGREGCAAGVFRQYDLHKLAYRDVRSRFDLTAQAAVRCIAKVADAFKVSRETAPVFRKHAAQPYDERIVRFAGDCVSIWTRAGRIRVPFVAGDRQRELLAFRKGEADLALIRGKWVLICTCEVPETEAFDPKDWIGVDLGLATIAATSDGDMHCGESVRRTRERYARRRAYHQRRAAKAEKRSGRRAQRRKLQRLSGREARFRRHENHVISKALAAEAERTARGLALEDLTQIRSRAKARGKRPRAGLHGWSFRQLRAFVASKAALAGVPVVYVDPSYTSQACSCCGSIDKRNRPNQSTFSCVACGHEAHADVNAARTVRSLARGLVTPLEHSREAA